MVFNNINILFYSYLQIQHHEFNFNNKFKMNENHFKQINTLHNFFYLSSKPFNINETFKMNNDENICNNIIFYKLSTDFGHFKNTYIFNDMYKINFQILFEELNDISIVYSGQTLFKFEFDNMSNIKDSFIYNDLYELMCRNFKNLCVYPKFFFNIMMEYL